MKLKLLHLAGLLASLATSQAAYLDAILSDQPVGYWRLDDPSGSTQVSNSGSLGTAADGSIIRGVSLESPGALATDSNPAATFDGNQSKIDVPFSPNLNTTAFTIETWAKVSSSSSGYRSPVASRDDSPQKGFILYATPNNGWEFWTGTGAQVGWDALGGAEVELDTWAHLVGVYDGTNKLFYVNGSRVGARRDVVVTPNGARVLRIGASATESVIGDFFFSGDIDEVAVYDKPLSADRILNHYVEATGAQPTATLSPTIAYQPFPSALFKGESTTLSVTALGTLPIAYQWKVNGLAIPGATASTYLISNADPSQNGDYSVEISNSSGSIESDAATVQISTIFKPVIISQPRPRAVLPQASAYFSVLAAGSSSFEYQWSFNNSPIAGATNAILTITNVQPSAVGAYKVTVKNPAGSTDSDPATLKLPVPAIQSYAATVAQDSPEGYWRLGETSGDVAVDATGSHDGSYLNGVTLGSSSALVGDSDPSALFSQVDKSKVDVAWSENLNSPTFTIECWAKVTGSPGTYRSPLTSRGDAPQRGYIFYATPDNTWEFWAGGGAAQGWITLYGPEVQLNSWAHLVGIYQRPTYYFYVNGNLVSQTLADFLPNDANPLRIGGGATEGDGNFFFTGNVDEVAVYSSALSEERILAHYVAGSPLTTPPTIVSQPRSTSALPGLAARFSVSVTGGLPISYQWKFNGQDLPGATLSSLTISNVSSSNIGEYQVVIRNAGGSITSDKASLSFPPIPAISYTDLIKSDGAVAYWRLGETEEAPALEEINANDGTYLNGTAFGSPGAIVNDPDTSASFITANQQKIDAPWTETQNPPEFTAECWAKVTGPAGNYRSPLTSRADGPQRGYIFYAEPGNTWQFWSGKGDTSGWDSIPGPAVRVNQWDHLVATYDGSIKRFYVNGVLAGTSSAAFAVNDTRPLRIGGGATEGTGDFFFQGSVDEVAIYAGALSEDQIISHYVAGVIGSAAPKVTISRSGNSVVITWTQGALESAPSVAGPWTTVPNVISPFNASTAGTTTFYRSRQ